jgi:hypothetical protein
MPVRPRAADKQRSKRAIPKIIEFEDRGIGPGQRLMKDPVAMRLTAWSMIDLAVMASTLQCDLFPGTHVINGALCLDAVNLKSRLR